MVLYQVMFTVGLQLVIMITM